MEDDGHEATPNGAGFDAEAGRNGDPEPFGQFATRTHGEPLHRRAHFAVGHRNLRSK